MDKSDESSELPSLKNLLKLKKKYDAPSVEQLPESYKSNSPKERLYTWAANNFHKQIRQKFPHLKPKFLVCLNECGVEKLICTFIKPTVLPFAHLFDIMSCASFVSDYIAFHPKHEIPHDVHTRVLSSPTLTLATQMGDSFEMCNVLTSFLTGFGFKAYVVCGLASRQVALMDRSKESFQLDDMQGEETEEMVESNLERYEIEQPPLLESKYCEYLDNLVNEDVSLQDEFVASISDSTKTNVDAEKCQEDNAHVHAWVLVQMSETQFFIEATTGERKNLNDANYLTINCIWNQENYWLCRQPKMKKTPRIDLEDETRWIQFIENKTTNESHDDCIEKRLLKPLQGWLTDLQVPKDNYDLLYRLGQKTEIFDGVKVEYFAPFLLKDGIVQRIQFYDKRSESQLPARTLDKFKYRHDRMISRETIPDQNQVIETFASGRKDNLRKHEHRRISGNHPMEYISDFFAQDRVDGLKTRRFKDLEITEFYESRMDRLSVFKANFAIREKKFGPADSSGRSHKQVVKIVQRFEASKRSRTFDMHSSVIGEDAALNSNDDDEDEDDEYNPGRVLDITRIMERIFDIESDRILIKFHREYGQLFCKTVEFLVPRESDANHPTKISMEDCKVYMVDPREETPCVKELNMIYQEQLKEQTIAVKQALNIDMEMNELLENRMKELSMNEMDIWKFDVKRNEQVRKGRIDKERARREKEKNILDLELDILAPFLEKQNIATLTKAQAIALKDECLANIRAELSEKEEEIKSHLDRLNEDLRDRKHVLTSDEINSKRFLINVLETRLSRQQRYSKSYYAKAEAKVLNDPRIQGILKSDR